jgi:hypothetical protein
MAELINDTILLKDNFLNVIEPKLLDINKNLKDYAQTLDFVGICEFTLENCEKTIPWETLDC